VNTPIDVGFQKLTPTEVRARVFSVSGIISQGVVPIGYGIMGIALDRFPAHRVALAVTVVLLFVVLLYIFKYLKEVCREFES